MEREPVAQIHVPIPARDGNGIQLKIFHLDAEGYVVLPLDPRQRSTAEQGNEDQMPVISGINFSELQPGRKIDSPQIKAALQLIQNFDSSPMAGLVELKRIDVSAPRVLIVTTGQGSEITFSLKDFDRQLHRWQQVHQECLKFHRAIATLDLAVKENTPLRMQEASALPPSAPRTAKPLRNRRRNV